MCKTYLAYDADPLRRDKPIYPGAYEYMPHAKPVLITLAALLIGVGAACSIFNATSSGCIAAAEDAGLPDSVIEQLRNRDGLSAVERAALRRVLVQADVDGVCDITAEDAATSSRSSDVRIDDEPRTGHWPEHRPCKSRSGAIQTGHPHRIGR